MSRKKTNEEFLKEVNELYPNNDYTFIDDYIDNKTKLKVRHNCTKCNNYEFMSAPSDFLQGYGCPKCAGNIKKTQKEFEQEVFEAVGNEYTVLGTYKNTMTKIKIRHNCKSCNNHEWDVVPISFLRGSRCPFCKRKKQKKTNEQFSKEVKNLYPNNDYTFIDDYIDNKTKLKVRHNCTKCNNYEFMSAPSDFLQGYGCPKCAGRMRKTQEEFEQEVFEAVGNEYTVLGTYKNGKTKLLMRHNCAKCNNHEWEAIPKNFLLNGTRCPKCNESKGERIISEILRNFQVIYKREFTFPNCKYKDVLRFDFAIFDKNENLLGLIEYDGEQHFSIRKKYGGEKGFKETQSRDSIKTKYCEDNNIPLLRIKYTQFDRIETIVNDFINNPHKYINDHSYDMTNKEYYENVKTNLKTK